MIGQTLGHYRILEKIGEGAAPGLRADPTWDSLRDHPRFQRLVSR